MGGLTLRPDQMGHQVKEVRTEGASVVVATFTNGETRLWDLTDDAEPLGVLGEVLADPKLFRRVEVIRSGRAIAWPNGADADADWFYHACRAIHVITTHYDREDDSLSAYFRRDVSDDIRAELVAEDLVYIQDLRLQEWVGFYCEAFSRHVEDNVWLDNLPSDAPFFDLAHPGRQETVHDVLIKAYDAYCQTNVGPLVTVEPRRPENPNQTSTEARGANWKARAARAAGEVGAFLAAG